MPTALLAEARAARGSGWRAVEAQHKNATLALVRGDLAGQAVLEDILDEAKPKLPDDAAGLHFLLATPFRYLPPPPHGSRFRGRFDAAVFYGAEEIRTACAEAGYWRLRFWLDSAGLSGQAAAMPMTLFEFHYAARALIDLTAAPFKAKRKAWIRPDDYAATQALANRARSEGIDLIRAESVRDNPHGRCLAILTPEVFKAVAQPFRNHQQTWSLYLQPPGLAVWSRNLDGEQHCFEFA